jgi:hypothetical protein
MKPAIKSFLGACLVFAGTAVSAQTERGCFAAGANVDMASTFTSSNGDENSLFSMAVEPQLGYFVVKNLQIGGLLRFGMNVNRVSKTTSFTSDFGPVIKYYVGKKSKKFFVQANAGYTTTTSIKESHVTGNDGYRVGAAAGFAWFINKNVSLETSLGYAYRAMKKFTEHRIPFRVGFNIFFLQKPKTEIKN